MASPSTDNIDQAAASGKRTYVSPSVVEYGTMRDITLTRGSTPHANRDSSGGGVNKTH